MHKEKVLEFKKKEILDRDKRIFELRLGLKRIKVQIENLLNNDELAQLEDDTLPLPGFGQTVEFSKKVPLGNLK